MIVTQDRPIDLICLGRVAVDLYADQLNVPLAQVSSFSKYLGGCAGNIAVGTARLGLTTMMLSCVGQDAMGDFIRNTLAAEGVLTDLLYTSPDHLTGLVLLGIEPPDRFPLLFYRENCADMQLKPTQLSADIFAQSRSLLITGTGLSQPGMRATTAAAIRLAKANQCVLIMDLDYRPVLWGMAQKGNGEDRCSSQSSVSAHYQAILGQCDVLVGTEEEFCVAAGEPEIETAIARLRHLSSAHLVVKAGAAGARVYPRGESTPIHSQPFAVTVLNVLGAGDAFISGLLQGLLRGSDWPRALQQANAAGALVVTRHGCAPAMPSQPELDYFIQHYPQIKATDLHRLHAMTVPPVPNPQQPSAPAPLAMGRHMIIADGGSGLYFSSLKLNAGEQVCLQEDMEIAALLLTGRVVFADQSRQYVAQRWDFFRQPPQVLHCSAFESLAIQAETDAELLIMQTQNDRPFAAQFFDGHNLLEQDRRGQGLLENTAFRLVRTVLDKRNRPESNLVVGEIVSMQGRWSSYPSHHHPQPEIYHYRFSEPQGYAFGEAGERVKRIQHRDTYLIRGGDVHAHCVAPGYAVYTLWFIRHLPEAAYGQPTFVDDHAWTRTPAANWRSLILEDA